VRKTSFLWPTAALVLAAFAAAASAADEGSSETVVVSATRIPTPISEVASSITVITADDIAARQNQTLPDVLKTVPGLNIVQTGGPGGLTSVFMRGTNSNHVKVLVDGIDVSDASDSSDSFDFSQFLVQDIQTVELLRGPQSGLYGSDAIGGVIVITTKSGNGPAQFVGKVEGGSFDTFNQGGGVSGSTGQFHYAANVEHFHSGATPVTPLDLLQPGEGRNDDYYDNLTGSTKLGFDVTDHFDLGLVARYTTGHLRDTADNFNNFPEFPDPTQSAGNTRQFYTRSTAHLVSFDGQLDQTLGVGYSHIDSSSFTPPADGPPSTFASERLKVDWQGAVKLAEGETMIVGAEHQRDEARQPVSASTTIDSGYGELQSSFDDLFFNTASVRYDTNDRFGSKVTYRLAPAFVWAATGTKLKASVGTGFKAPTLAEMFQSFPEFGFVANPNLKPESSLGLDVGFEQAVLGSAVTFGVTYFRNNIKNLIDDNADFTSYANVGRAHTEGVESFIAYQPLKTLTFRLDYTYTQADDDILNEELLRRPKHKADLNANWQATTRLSLDATLLTVSSWIDGNRDFTIPRLNAPGYTTADIAASFDITDQLAITARIDNLFNRRYENPVGYLQPPLGAFAGIKVKL
jgi:vitamin B12 transporter